jgi:REP element-mobilizing transposase RayT
MLFYRRRLPHWIPDYAFVFVTWRLAGSWQTTRNDGLPHLHSGPVWLQDARIASVVANALRYGERVRQFYTLQAWVIVPNHVHVILEPRIALPDIMRWLKGRTSRVANRILGRTGMPFWQDESFDHWVRSEGELQDLIGYVEGNPVKAKLVVAEEQWLWSSARLRADDKKDRLPHSDLNSRHGQECLRYPTAQFRRSMIVGGS